MVLAVQVIICKIKMQINMLKQEIPNGKTCIDNYVQCPPQRRGEMVQNYNVRHEDCGGELKLYKIYIKLGLLR